RMDVVYVALLPIEALVYPCRLNKSLVYEVLLCGGIHDYDDLVVNTLFTHRQVNPIESSFVGKFFGFINNKYANISNRLQVCCVFSARTDYSSEIYGTTVGF